MVPLDYLYLGTQKNAMEGIQMSAQGMTLRNSSHQISMAPDSQSMAMQQVSGDHIP